LIIGIFFKKFFSIGVTSQDSNRMDFQYFAQFFTTPGSSGRLGMFFLVLWFFWNWYTMGQESFLRVAGIYFFSGAFCIILVVLGFKFGIWISGIRSSQFSTKLFSERSKFKGRNHRGPGFLGALKRRQNILPQQAIRKRILAGKNFGCRRRVVVCNSAEGMKIRGLVRTSLTTPQRVSMSPYSARLRVGKGLLLKWWEQWKEEWWRW
jgi:hypothetical protein